jgi:2-polyprenyl-6-methoxyphenol hydroxylase-like FAD-dependent oxidoreductase
MKALVAGAGIAGLAAALSLNRRGWHVEIVERARNFRSGGYMIDFFGPGFDAAERLGLLPALERHCSDIDKVDWVGPDGRLDAKLNYRLMQRAAHGRLFPLLRGDVEEVLRDALPAEIGVRFGTSVTAVAQDDAGVQATLSDGNVTTADLLVGADGIHSTVRQALFGAERRFLRPLGYRTAAYFFEDAEVARKLGGTFSIMTLPGRLAGFYEAKPGRLASFFVRTDDGLEPDHDPAATLRARFGDLGWVVPAALDAAPPTAEIYEDVVAQVEMPRWSDGRVVLIGDAAYAVSLVAGQGASMALAGGTLLGELLTPGTAIEPALREMEARLRPAVLKKQRSGRRTARWFVPATPLHIALRNLAFRAMNTRLLSGLLSKVFSLDSKGFAIGAKHG